MFFFTWAKSWCYISFFFQRGQILEIFLVCLFKYLFLIFRKSIFKHFIYKLIKKYGITIAFISASFFVTLFWSTKSGLWFSRLLSYDRFSSPVLHPVLTKLLLSNFSYLRWIVIIAFLNKLVDFIRSPNLFVDTSL